MGVSANSFLIINKFSDLRILSLNFLKKLRENISLFMPR